MHAAAVSFKKNGILISGDNGSGKSLLSLALCRNGFHFLSDDLIAIKFYRKRIQAFSILSHCNISTKVGDSFPELKPLEKYPVFENKVSFFPSDFYDKKVKKKTTPELLLFPKICKKTKSNLKEISKQEALINLIGQSAFSPIKEIAGKKVLALKQLAEQCRSYKFYSGKDIISNSFDFEILKKL